MFLSVEQTVSQTLPRSVIDCVDEITVTHLQNKTLYETIDTVKQIKEQNPNKNIVPHIAARNLHSKKELVDCCEQFKSLGVATVLVIGGNLRQGRFYQSAYQLCGTIKEHDLRRLCGVYPQKETYGDVQRKKYTSFSGGITQFCLSTKLLNQFHANTRIGVPSMCSLSNLLKYMQRCGVIASTKAAATNLSGIAYLNATGFDTAKFVSNIDNTAFHVYNFGKIEQTVAKLREQI